MDRWINLAGDVWAVVFAASFALSIVVGVIQHRRGKEFLDTPLLPVMAVLHFAWVVPVMLFMVGVSVFRYWPLILIAIVAASLSAWFARKPHPKR